MAKCHSGTGQGKLYVVGTGPGDLNNLTPAATMAIADSNCIVGYKTYLELIPALLIGKEVFSSDMMKETDRCRKALEMAVDGTKVSLVSGGDPGIYAMAGLVFEMIKARNLEVAVEVIPGIAALNACAARLGAPLMHDFASISLSDLLTPWEVIEKRLAAAAQADFIIVLYNPKSKRRTGQIVKARDIIMAVRDPHTPVGIVTGASRKNERVELTTLAKMLTGNINMQSTLIIGNSQTYSWHNYMITPRGYDRKYSF